MSEDFTNTAVRDNTAQQLESQGDHINTQASEASLREVNSTPVDPSTKPDLAAESKAMTQGDNPTLPDLEISGFNDTERGSGNKGDRKNEKKDGSKESAEPTPEQFKKDVVDAVSRGHVSEPGVRDELETVAQRAFKEGGNKGLEKLQGELDQGVKKNFGEKGGFEMSPVQTNARGDKFVHFDSRTSGTDKRTGKELVETQSSILSLDSPKTKKH